MHLFFLNLLDYFKVFFSVIEMQTKRLGMAGGKSPPGEGIFPPVLYQETLGILWKPTGGQALSPQSEVVFLPWPWTLSLALNG